jgi:hypothetical protein
MLWLPEVPSSLVFEQIKAGESITITDPNMTLLFFNVFREAVELVCLLLSMVILVICLLTRHLQEHWWDGTSFKRTLSC